MCSGDYEVGGSYCLRFGGRGVDQRFGDALLEVISPLGVEARLAAIEQFDKQDAARRRALEHKLQQVEYEARRAFEQYDEVDPRRRLVAEELERRWNGKLEEVEAVKASLADLDRQKSQLSASERAEFEAMGKHFRDVWFAPSLPPDLRKRIVRSVVEEIIADERAAGVLSFIVHWKGGAHTQFEMNKPRSAAGKKNASQDIDLIRRMAGRHDDRVIAAVLNRLGRQTGKGNRWTQQRVMFARREHGISSRTKADPNVLSLMGAARYCRVSNTTIQKLIDAKILPCEQVASFAPQEIRRADLDSEPVRSIVERLRTTGKLVLPGVCRRNRSLSSSDSQ